MSLAQVFQNTNPLDRDFEFQRACLAEQIETERILFHLTVAPFEPLTPGSGGGVLLGRRRSLPMLLERESQGEDLESLRRAPGRARLVSITVVFL